MTYQKKLTAQKKKKGLLDAAIDVSIFNSTKNF